MLSRARANKQLFLIDRTFLPNARETLPPIACKMLPHYIRLLEFPSIASQQALMQFAANICNSIESAQQTFTLLRAEQTPTRPH